MEHSEPATDGIATFVGLEDLASDEPLSVLPPEYIGAGLPDIPGGAMLDSESRSQRQVIRAIAVSGVLLSVVYLVWRALFTIEIGAWFVAIPLIALEAHHAVGLGLTTFALWDLDPAPGWHAVDATGLRVALLIETSGESADALVPVIGAAVAIEPVHETWVLDATARPDIKRLAEGLGGRYLTGTLADAFEQAKVDVIGVVGPDQVVAADFLRHTLGYLEDPKVSVVQTSDRYSGARDDETDDDESSPDIDSARHRIILPARNRWNAVQWMGRGAIVRVDAARSVRIYPSDAVGSATQTSIQMHKQGWRIIAHNEVLVRTLTPYDARRVTTERMLEARASRKAIRSARVLTSSGLALSQRLAYLVSGGPRFERLRTLLFVAVPVAVLAVGTVPVAGDLRFFGPLMGAVAYFQYLGLRFLGRGHYPSWREVVFGTPSMPSVIPTLGGFIRQTRAPRSSSVADGPIRDAPPWALIGVMALSGGTLVWGALTLSGFTVVTYPNPWAVYGTAVFLGIELTLFVGAMQRVFYPESRKERRAAVRFDVDMAARIGDLTARVVDLSLTGAALKMRRQVGADPWVLTANEGIHPGQSVRLELLQQGIDLEAQVVRVEVGDRGAVDVGLNFKTGQWPGVQELAVVLFHGDLFPSEPGPVREHVRLVGSDDLTRFEPDRRVGAGTSAADRRTDSPRNSEESSYGRYTTRIG